MATFAARPAAIAVIPAHDEAASLPALVGELRDQVPGLEILVVDDASEDGTAELLPRLDVRWLRLEEQLGIGGAVRAGLRYARHLGFDRAVRLDADGQHRPDDVAALLAALDLGADAAVGSRFKEPTGWRTTPGRRFAQRVLATALSALVRRPVTDPTSGFWAFGPRALKLLAGHHPTGYAEPELLLFLHRNGLRVQEVSVHMRERFAGTTTLTLPRAGVALARAVLAMVVVPLRGTADEGLE